MANPLTGDFEAVLQVSGATVNRLVASIHQNHGLTTVALPATDVQAHFKAATTPQ